MVLGIFTPGSFKAPPRVGFEQCATLIESKSMAEGFDGRITVAERKPRSVDTNRADGVPKLPVLNKFQTQTNIRGQDSPDPDKFDVNVDAKAALELLRLFPPLLICLCENFVRVFDLKHELMDDDTMQK